MPYLVTAIAVALALILGVAWFATKGKSETDEHNDSDNWGI